jgi:integrase
MENPTLRRRSSVLATRSTSAAAGISKSSALPSSARYPEPGTKSHDRGHLNRDLVFPNKEGTYMRRVRTSAASKSWFKTAAESIGVPQLHIHDLRHTAASLAVQSGANVKAIQRMLGHASAAMTLDVYADLFDDDLDAVSTALDQARAAQLAARAGRAPLTGD